MNRRSTYLLAFAAALLWLLAGVLPAAAGCPHPDGRAAQTLRAAPLERPQWEDVGLEDLLLTVVQPSLEAPTSHRSTHESAHCAAPAAPRASLHAPRCPLRSALPHRAVPGYLYLLLCLRL